MNRVKAPEDMVAMPQAMTPIAKKISRQNPNYPQHRRGYRPVRKQLSISHHIALERNHQHEQKWNPGQFPQIIHDVPHDVLIEAAIQIPLIRGQGKPSLED